MFFERQLLSLTICLHGPVLQYLGHQAVLTRHAPSLAAHLAHASDSAGSAKVASLRPFGNASGKISHGRKSVNRRPPASRGGLTASPWHVRESAELSSEQPIQVTPRQTILVDNREVFESPALHAAASPCAAGVTGWSLSVSGNSLSPAPPAPSFPISGYDEGALPLQKRPTTAP